MSLAAAAACYADFTEIRGLTIGGVTVDGFWIAVAIVVGVAVYTLLAVVGYVRRSERQWKQVDRSKLKTWEDDED